MDDISVPVVYVVNRTIPREETFVVLQTLRITPCCCAVISNILDAELAIQLAPEVLRAETEEKAIELGKTVAANFKRAVLVVGQANFLDAIWSDGRREAVAKSC
jgi:hypothetical protein